MGPPGHSVWISGLCCEYRLPGWDIATLEVLGHWMWVLSLLCDGWLVGWDIAIIWDMENFFGGEMEGLEAGFTGAMNCAPTFSTPGNVRVEHLFRVYDKASELSRI